MRIPLSLVLALPLALSAPAQDSKPSGPVVGAAAPSFRVNDHKGQLTKVGGAAEKWTVLAFYPKASTGG